MRGGGACTIFGRRDHPNQSDLIGPSLQHRGYSTKITDLHIVFEHFILLCNSQQPWLQVHVCWHVNAMRSPVCPGRECVGLWILTFVCFRTETVMRVTWLIPSNFLCLFQTTFSESITTGEWFIGTAGISAARSHHSPHPVSPFLRLIPSINASRRALGYHSSSTLLSCTLMSLHPSSSFSIKGSSMGSSYLVLWICKLLLSVRQAIGKMLNAAPWPA